eukprot:TRINITY_DN16848_c0_g1_i3.p1 TRINITY_DN16848_c0_g1~~TRINITY_DN16848_c0_g1_i3.p1  ORF type:complete len:339 (+),score=63.08 TRINITY_DN16848_c0_g1_i3:60-1019(+)
MQDVTHLAMASELTAGKELQHTVQYDMLSALTTTKSDKPETTALQMKLSGLEGLPRHTLAQQRQIRELRQRIGYALARERKEKESGAKKSGSRSGERRGRDRRDRKSSRRRSLTPERRRRRDRSYDSYDDSDRDRDRDRERPSRTNQQRDGGEVSKPRRTCPFLVRLFIKIDTVRVNERFDKPPLIRLFNNIEWTDKDSFKSELAEFQLHTWMDAPLSELLDTVVRACKFLKGKEIRTFNFGSVKPHLNRRPKSTVTKFLGHAVPTLKEYSYMRVNPQMDKSQATLGDLGHQIGEYIVIAVEACEGRQQRGRSGSGSSY